MSYVVSWVNGTARRLPAPRPWMVLGALVVCSWLVMIYGARIAAHRGSYYYDGGDGTWYYTSGWILAHGHIPESTIGYAYSLLLAPLTLITGSNILLGLRGIMIVNGLILVPLLVVSIYGLTKAIGGRGFAYAASLIWVLLPILGLHYFYSSYHTQFVDVTLPDALGLTALADFPSMVCVTVAAYFAYRAFSTASRIDALTAGLVAGVALGVKPANGLFLPAPFIAFALTRQPRQFALFAAGLVPSLIALLLWKYKGLGTLPLFASQPVAIAASAQAILPVGGFDIGKYLHLNWGTLTHNIDGFREWGWSRRLLEWSVVAGAIGLARRSFPGAAFVVVWLATYLIAKGSRFTMAAGDFLTHLLPALPALFVLGVSIVFLVPVYGRRPISPAARASWPQSRRDRRWTLGVAAFLASVPILLFAALPPLTAPAAADFEAVDLYIPANQFPLGAVTTAGAVHLSWPTQSTGGANARYVVFRAANADGLNCNPVAHATSQCVYTANPVGAVSGATAFVDHPGRGRWYYRVALQVAAYGPNANGNTVLLSSPASATVSR